MNTRNLFNANADQIKAEYTRIAKEVDAEIARRSNRPGQQSQIIKQLAGEYGLSAPTLTSILRVYRKEQRQAAEAKRKADVIRLHFVGFTNQEIAKELSLNTKTVARTLEGEADLVKALRTSLLPKSGSPA